MTDAQIRCPRCDLVHTPTPVGCPRCHSIRQTNRLILTIVFVCVLAAIGAVIGGLFFGLDT